MKNPFSFGGERVSELRLLKPALAGFLARPQAELQIGAVPAAGQEEARIYAPSH